MLNAIKNSKGWLMLVVQTNQGFQFQTTHLFILCSIWENLENSIFSWLEIYIY